MKLLACAVVLSFAFPSFAKKNNEPPTEALYIVPSAPQAVSHSRFTVKIIKAFTGSDTQTIAYVFPEVLAGEANKIIEFTRVAPDENNWTSPWMDAYCTTLDEMFSCNIHVKKAEQVRFHWSDLFVATANANEGLLTKENSLAHLAQMGFSPADFDKYSQVISEFYSNEPAGFLSYEFE